MEIIKEIHPKILSLLTTYYCTAACKNCCFECNQHRKGRMSFQQMASYINECISTFPTIKIVVFSGGECFSLKEELYKIISFAHEKQLLTRVVTNGYWAESYEKAFDILKKLKELGLDELNLSTGDDHQKWIPFNNIINAIKASVELELTCLVNIETNPNSIFTEKDFRNNDCLKDYIQNKKISFSSGIWIPFNEEDKIKRDMNYRKLSEHRILNPPILSHGCNSLFESIPIDPEGNVYACCGLACTKIEFLNIGNINQQDIREIYSKQFDDFLKIWSYVDGPKFILNKIAEKTSERNMINADMHNCEACLLLFNDYKKIEYIRKHIQEYIPDVILKYSIKQKKQRKK